MAIRVTSFDFDGCLFNINYLFSDDRNIIAHNKEFLDSIKAANGNYSKSIAFIGSNRQSKDVEESNRSKGYCFPAIKKITKYLDIPFDPLLMADIYGNLEHGTSYARALNPRSQKHADWIFDETKATILYAQMHKIATENPNEEIIFDFYDDHGNGHIKPVDILEKLQKFYKKYPDMMPKNVTLRLHHYAGESITLLAEIKGEGIIDTNYSQTVMDMAEQAMAAEGVDNVIHSADYVDPTKLENRVPLNAGVVIKPINIIYPGDIIDAPAPAPVGPVVFDDTKMKAFEDLLGKVSVRRRMFFEDGEYPNSDAHKATKTLYNALYDNKKKFKSKEMSYEDFRKDCTAAIETAHTVLDQHRGWKDVLLNLLLAVTILGPLIKGCVNLVQDRPFFFFTKTESAKLLDEVAESVAELAAPSA